MNVEDYAAKLRTTLYGGDLELSIFVHLFKLKVFLYAAHQWKGRVRERLEPQINVLPEDEEKPEGGEISLLFEPGETGGQDHYSWMIQRSKPLDEFSMPGEVTSDSEPDAVTQALLPPTPKPAAVKTVVIPPPHHPHETLT